MAVATLERILDEIKRLPLEDLHAVERTVQELLSPTQREAEREAALRVLQESGLVKQIKRPSMLPQIERPPVPILGKPLSETIIEERR